jgi:tetratricopeptide (TPR) repeat protein/transglutaminase-like putative cysteine protease
MRHFHLRPCCVGLLLVSSLFVLHGQDKSATPWEARAAFSASPQDVRNAAAKIKADRSSSATILSDEIFISIDETNRVIHRQHFVYRVDSSDAMRWAGTVEALYSPWHQKKPEIQARVISPEGRVSTLNPSVLTEAPAHDQRPDIYQDARVLSGPLPSVGVGSIVEEQIVTEDTAPLFRAGIMRRLLVGYDDPTVHTLMELRAPTSLNLRYKIRGPALVNTTQTQENGFTKIRFEQMNVPAFEIPERNTPSDFEPVPAIDYSTGASWSAIAAAYYNQVAPSIQPGEVSALLEGSSGLKGDALIRRILTNLHRRIRYTGLEFGASAIIPHPAGETLKSGYGDCKDKALVLVSALKAAGVPAQIALLNIRGDDDVSPELAGIGVFNHAIVYIPGNPEMWIDATAPYYEPGDLPWVDQGRLALLIGPDTRDLVRTPINLPAQNANIHRGEYSLPQYGNTKIVDSFESTGEQAAMLREKYGQGETQSSRDYLEYYARTRFLARGVSRVEHTKGDDLTQPFRLKLTIDQAASGGSALKSARVAINPENLLWGYQGYVYFPDVSAASGPPEWKARQNDIEIQPFVTDWHYRIIPPPGFGHPILPKDVERSFGPAKLVQRYQLNPDGSVEFFWHFDSVKARYTPSEVQALQRDANELLSVNGIEIVFQENGAHLMSQGKLREALSYYSSQMRQQPNDAVYRMSIAMTLIEAGFGDQARKEAGRATQLDPTNANAWAALAFTLRHDSVGRNLHIGFDLDGSTSAYRKAIELDPQQWRNYADLALLYEVNASGERYGPGTSLDDAASVLRKLVKLDSDKGEEYTNQLLYALFYSSRWNEVLQTAASLPSSSTREAIVLATIAARDGAPAAVSEAERRDSNSHTRGQSLLAASILLVKCRRYAPAVALMTAALPGQDDPSQLRARIELTRKARPTPELLLPPGNPQRVVQDYLLVLLNPNSQLSDYTRLVTVDPADEKDEFKNSMEEGLRLRTQLTSQGAPLWVAQDMTLANLQMFTEGDDTSGYRIRVLSSTNDARVALISRRNGRYMMVGMTDYVAMVGDEVLRRIAANDLKGAKLWLDWTREEVKSNAGDDPLGGSMLPRFWTRGDNSDPARMRMAALSLLVGSSEIRQYVPELTAARASAADATAADKVDLLLVYAASTLKDWKLYHEVAVRLLAAHPYSDFALATAVSAAIHNQEWDLGQKAIAARLLHSPGDPVAIRNAASLAEGKQDFAQARSILRPLIESGRASVNDINSYTWDALFVGTVSDEDIALMERAVASRKRESFATAHTLACLYALKGKTKEARDLLIRAMDLLGIEQPNESIWFGFGLIAEQYGLNDVALSLYRRVEAAPDPTAGSIYELALIRERLINSIARTQRASAAVM